MVFENEKAIYNGLDGTQITNSTHTFSVEDLCAVSVQCCYSQAVRYMCFVS